MFSSFTHSNESKVLFLNAICTLTSVFSIADKDLRVRNHRPAAKIVTDTTKPCKRDHEKTSHVFQL